jgi:hypothetical protein
MTRGDNHNTTKSKEAHMPLHQLNRERQLQPKKPTYSDAEEPELSKDIVVINFRERLVPGSVRM